MSSPSSEEPVLINASQPFHESILQAVMKQIPTRPEAAVLLHYINQLQPENEAQLHDVLDVAMEAHAQMMAEQQPTQDEIAMFKQRIKNLVANKGEALDEATSRHLDNLERRAQIKRDMNLLQEKMEAWTSLQLKASPEDDSSLLNLQKELLDLNVDILAYESTLKAEDPLCELLKALNSALEFAVDQQTIIDKFDHISAALDSVDLREI